MDTTEQKLTKRDRTKQRMLDEIINWPYEFKITGRLLALKLGNHERTLKNYWVELKDEIKEKNKQIEHNQITILSTKTEQ